MLRQLGVQGLARSDLVQYEQRALTVQQFVNMNALAGASDIEKP